jgi:hypothetical protein
MKPWKAKKTLLIVGEGKHEVAFLSHAKRLFVMRDCGLSVHVKDAHGKGALHVIKCAVKHSRNAAYDAVAVLLDSDTWDVRADREARKGKVIVLKSEQCLEDMLLRVIGIRSRPAGASLKEIFAPHVKNKPGDSECYAEEFGVDVLRAARNTEPTIALLMSLLES